ncbi:MAG: DUF3306 domain-containing protein [Proteobacteria bacterium]|nr:DUF3306 domain-containing protein [Pseudomonadota bacterium]
MNRDSDDPRDNGAGRLARWSQRKLQARNTTQTNSADAKPAITPPRLTDADMPPLESLSESSEFSGFMSDGVSDELQRLALRKLFHLPGFCLRDGLDDYDEDFTTMTRLADVVTARITEQITEEVNPPSAKQPRHANEAHLDQTDSGDAVASLEKESSTMQPDTLAGAQLKQMVDEDGSES